MLRKTKLSWKCYSCRPDIVTLEALVFSSPVVFHQKATYVTKSLAFEMGPFSYKVAQHHGTLMVMTIDCVSRPSRFITSQEVNELKSAGVAMGWLPVSVNRRTIFMARQC